MRLENTIPAADTALAPAIAPRADAQPANGFDKVLDAVAKREVKQPAPKQKPKAKPEAPPEAQKPRESEKAEPAKPDTTAKPAAKPKTTAAESTAAVTPPEELTGTEPNDIVYAIANILGVSPETLMEWLGQLDLKPQDLLTDPQAVIDLLVVAFGASDAASLLTLASFPEVYKAVNEAIAKLKAQTEAEAQQTQQPVTAETETKSPAAQAARLESLQVTDGDDGEIVVTARPQDAAAETETTAEEDFFLRQTETARPVAAAERPAQSDTQTGSHTDPDGNPAAQADHADIPVVAAVAEAVAVRVAEAVSAVRQTAAPVSAPDVMSQIITRVRAQGGEHFNELRMTLKPDNLGEVTLRVVTQNSIVTAQFVAESQRVKEVLEANFNQLRDALQEQGVQVSDLSVSVRQDENERMNQFAQARQNSQARIRRIQESSPEEASAFGAEVDPTAVLTGRVDVSA